MLNLSGKAFLLSVLGGRNFPRRGIGVELNRAGILLGGVALQNFRRGSSAPICICVNEILPASNWRRNPKPDGKEDSSWFSPQLHCCTES